MKVAKNTSIVSNATTTIAAATAKTTIPITCGNSCSKTINMLMSNNGLSFNKSDTLKMINDDIISNTTNTLFCEQVNTVTNLFEKWNNCERTVVMYALLKRLQYSSLKFLQYSIDSTLTQTMACSTNLSTVVIDMNANNPTYLMKLLQIYKTPPHPNTNAAISVPATTNINTNTTNKLSSSSISDNDFMSCYGADFQLAAGSDENRKKDERRTKEEVLYELINMLPLLKPGNEDAKFVYMQLIPLTVEDALTRLVPFDLVQQIFSYMLIHPAVLSEDRRLLNDMLRQLEEKMPQTATSCPVLNLGIKTMNKISTRQPSLNINVNSHHNNVNNNLTSEFNNSLNIPTTTCTSSALNTNQNNYHNQNYNNGSISSCSSLSSVSSRNSDWQTIAPPCKYPHGQQHHQQQQQQQKNQIQYSETADRWSALIKSQPMSMTTNIGSALGHNSEHYCDNYDGIKLNDLASSQNSLRLPIGSARLDICDANSAVLANGVAAAAATNSTDLSLNTQSTGSSLLLGGGNCNSNPIINIISNSGNNCLISHNINGIIEDTSDTSFSKNGTEILDFDSNLNETCSSSNNSVGQSHQPMSYAVMFMNNNRDHLGYNRLSLDSKLGALKTRRSNSLTTQTFLSSTSSSNSSVITVNDNYSNSTENLAQFANKPRSYSLSIEHHRNSLTNSGSDTRLDDFKPSYIKFQNANIGMSNIGLWLKSLRLHKYLDLFKEMTYEAMLQITEDYLINLGVTKGASHKLALCIEKLQDRRKHLIKMEEELISGQMKLQSALEDMANLVLTPMKPIDHLPHITSTDNENVALYFFRVLDLICSIIYKESYALTDDEALSLLLWIIDRTIHNEAFAHQVNQLKEHKLKLSKVKMSLTPKTVHLSKNGSNGSLNKSSNFCRWNGKGRKSDQKNGSNDRINYRKNSNDMLLFPLGCLQQQQQQSHTADNNTHNAIGGGQFDKQHLQYQHHQHQHQPSTTIPLLRNSHYSNVAISQQYTTTAATANVTSNLVMPDHRHSIMLTNGQQQQQPVSQPQCQAQQQKSLPAATPIGRASYSNVDLLDDAKIENDRKLQSPLPLPLPAPPSQCNNNFPLALINQSNNHLLFSPTITEQLKQQKQTLTDNCRKNIAIITSNADEIVQGIHGQQQQQQPQQQQQHQQSQQHSTLFKSLKVRSSSDSCSCSSSSSCNNTTLGNSNNNNSLLTKHRQHQQRQQQQQQQQQQQKQQQQQTQLFQHQQQQEKLKLLAAAAATAANHNPCNHIHKQQQSGSNSIIMNSSNMCNNSNNIGTTKILSTVPATSSSLLGDTANIAKNNVKNTILNCTNCCLVPLLESPSSTITNETTTKNDVTSITTTTFTADMDTDMDTIHPNRNAHTSEIDVNSLDQLETLCLQMTEQAIN